MPKKKLEKKTEIWCLELNAQRDQVERAAQVLGEVPFPEALAVSHFETDKPQEFQLRVLYEQQPSASHIQTLLKPIDRALSFTLKPLESIDWVSKSQEDLKPVRAGRFIVTSKAHAAHTPPGTVPLLIEAGQAFGTGHHATTLGCLLALDWLARRKTIHHPLDLGCGSGVLGIAAVKLWKCKVRISDIDPVAVETAHDNARKNAVGPLIEAITANGVRHPRLVRASPYDLIMANILARPLVKLAPALAQLLKPGGIVILSGLLKSQENWVRSVYGQQGLTLRNTILLDEWSTLILART